MPQKRKLEIIEISGDEDEVPPTLSTTKHHTGNDGNDDLSPISALLSKNYYPATFSSEYRPSRTTESVDVSVATTSSTVAPSSHPSSRGLLAFGFTKAKRPDVGREIQRLPVASGSAASISTASGTTAATRSSTILDSTTIIPLEMVVVIIAISRVSHTGNNKKTVEELHDRNQELIRLSTLIHSTSHRGCTCAFQEHSIVLNGVSSNNSATANSTTAPRMQELVKKLRQLKIGGLQQEILLTVSTNDGFFTNPTSFITFFGEFTSLQLTYIIHDIKGKPPRVFKIQDIIQAIREIHNAVRKSNDAHALIREMLIIAVGKLIQTKGMLIVRGQTFGRNSAQLTPLDDLEGTEEDDFTLNDPSPRYYRAFQVSDQNGKPILRFREQTRVTIKTSAVSDKLLCPVSGCLISCSSMIELTGHLVSHIISGVCPLCPREEQQLRYLAKLDVIHHIERHISRVSNNAKKLWECPFCWATTPGRDSTLYHIQNIHLRSFEILTFAERAQLLPIARDQLKKLVHNSLLLRKEIAIRRLQEPLRSIALTWAFQTPCEATDERQFCASYFQDTMDPGGDGRLFTHGDLLGEGNRYIRDDHVQTIHVVWHADGRFGCPMKCCSRTFATDNVEAATHVHKSGKVPRTAGKCPFCGEAKTVLFNHIQRHLPLLLRCKEPDCCHVVDCEGGMKKHMQTHHPTV
ncbi:hypothetical protein LTR67_002505 [Exophiala xenobiotica]